MQQRQRSSRSRRFGSGWGLSALLLVPTALYAAEPVRTDLPSRTGQSQAVPDEPPIGGAPIAAQPANPNTGIIRYDAAFFAEFQPTTAIDMVRRLPGFTFEPGDNTVRGFAGALGNVLIDGQRPASKAVLLEDVLRRIPVANVEAVEVIRGGAPGINMQGQPIVANVVRRGGNSTVHAGELIGLFASEYDPGIGVRLESTRNSDRLSLSGSLNVRDEQQYGSTGKGEQIRRNDRGEVILASGFETDWSQQQIQANGAAEYNSGPGLLRINVGGTAQDTDQYDMLVPWSNVPSTAEGEIFTNIRLDQGEAGVDYEHVIGDDSIGRVLLLQTVERKVITADAANPTSQQRSEDEATRGESILRSSLTYRFSPMLTVESGLEGAYNSLDVDASLVRNGVAVDLPANNVTVKERRGEVFVDTRWKFTPRVAGDIGIRYETSTITQSGDANARRTLSYPKPRAVITWNLDGNLQLRARAERTVSQLEFRDFASQASLDAGIINSGNTDLRPENAWEFEAAIEKRFWEGGAAQLGYTHALVSDTVDFVPVGNFDTPGNLGDSKRGQVALGLSMPLGRLGLAGTQLRFNSTWTWSEVDDPYTQQSRRISKDAPLSGNAVITKEFAALNSTLTLEDSYSKRETSYRFDEIRTEHWDHFFRLYWDWMPKSDTVVRLMFNNFTGRPRSRWRTVYDATRAGGQILYHEDRHIDALRFIQLQVRKTF